MMWLRCIGRAIAYRIMRVKFICDRKIVHIITVEEAFWTSILGGFIWGLRYLHTSKLLIGGDLSGHVWATYNGFESVHGDSWLTILVVIWLDLV